MFAVVVVVVVVVVVAVVVVARAPFLVSLSGPYLPLHIAASLRAALPPATVAREAFARWAMAIAALLLYLHICYCFIVDSMIVKSVVYNAMSMIQSGQAVRGRIRSRNMKHLRWDKDKLALAIQNGTGRRELLESIIGRWSPFDEFAKLNSLDEHWKAMIESIQQDIDKLALAIPNGTKAKLALAIQNGSGPNCPRTTHDKEIVTECPFNKTMVDLSVTGLVDDLEKKAHSPRWQC